MPDGPVVEADAIRLPAPPPPPRRVNLANGLTLLRVALAPLVIWLVAVDTTRARWWAFGLFAFAAVTDSVDGWLARRWFLVTRVGQLADPIADKLLIIGSLVCLAALEELPWWAVVVIVAREVAVTFLRVRLVRQHDLVMPASAWGKVKTVGQIVAVEAFLVPSLPAPVPVALLYVAVALTVLSGVDYAFRAGRLVRASGLAA